MQEEQTTMQEEPQDKSNNNPTSGVEHNKREAKQPKKTKALKITNKILTFKTL